MTTRNEQCSLFVGGPIPARAGVGLRAQHHRDVLTARRGVGWLEAHSENYFAIGSLAFRALLAARECYALSLHGVGLSLGSCDPLDAIHLAKLKNLIRQAEPALVSEHLCWSAADGRHLNDLLPLPYTEEALRHVCARVDAVQNELGRQILLENVSSYLQYRCSTLREPEFLRAVIAETGCGLLLDVNNVYVSAMNHGFDAREYLQQIPQQSVQEIHLAGHTILAHRGREIRIDTHSAPVCDAVWELYRRAIERLGPVPTLIEWDTDIPALDVLADEATKADAIMEARYADAA